MENFMAKKLGKEKAKTTLHLLKYLIKITKIKAPEQIKQEIYHKIKKLENKIDITKDRLNILKKFDNISIYSLGLLIKVG